MFLQIPNLLAPAEVQSIAQIARQARFIDGKRSNPHNVVKQNVIADPSDAQAQKASHIALLALQRSEEAQNFIFPRRVPAPTLSRYGVGM
jgi:PKHD-type hydroxylase